MFTPDRRDLVSVLEQAFGEDVEFDDEYANASLLLDTKYYSARVMINLLLLGDVSRMKQDEGESTGKKRSVARSARPSKSKSTGRLSDG